MEGVVEVRRGRRIARRWRPSRRCARAGARRSARRRRWRARPCPRAAARSGRPRAARLRRARRPRSRRPRRTARSRRAPGGVRASRTTVGSAARLGGQRGLVERRAGGADRRPRSGARSPSTPAHGPRAPRAEPTRGTPHCRPHTYIAATDWPVSQKEPHVDLNDTPEQAEYREKVRAWLEDHRSEAPAVSSTRAGAEDDGYVDARRAWQGKLAEGGLAGVTWPQEYGGQGMGPIEQVIANQEIGKAGVPGILDVIGVGMLGPTLIAHGIRRAEAALPRPDAPRRRGLVPALLRAGRRLGPRRGADARQAQRRRQLGAQRAEGVDDERAVRRLRPAPRPHRPRAAQAQGPHDVRAADGRRGRHDARAAPDLRRGRVQRGLLRRRPARRRRGRRPGQRRLAHGADDADVRARDDRPGLGGHGLPRGPLRARRSPPIPTPASTPTSASAWARSAPTCWP